jgi:AcrR family transcriptional regulator
MAKSGPSSKLRTEGTPGSVETRRALVAAAIESLRADGFSGASARAIAARAGCNQGLVFYHFGSVTSLLLAALDSVSADRLARYGTAVESVESPRELTDVAAAIFREDLDAGYVTVLAEMIAGASSTPGLGREVADRIAPWTAFAQRAIDANLGPVLGAMIPSDDAAYAVVALYLGLGMLSHLDGDPSRALGLFDHARQLATLFEALGGNAGGAAPSEAS